MTNNGRIVVVDDTPANLHLLSNLLEERDYEIRAFPSAKLALMAMENFQPDLILLDINMPQMNGYEMCDTLKENEKLRDIPVIFISALNEVFDKVKAFSVGGVDYITKPVQAEEVLARVETHLQLFRLQQMLKQKNFMQSQQLANQNRQLKTLNQQLEKTNQQLQEKYLQLEQAQLQLVQNEKMATLGQLVAGVGHEINNPLGFVSGNIEMAQDYVVDLLEIIADYRQEVGQPSPDLVEKVEAKDLEFIVEDFPKIINSMQQGIGRLKEISLSLRTFARRDTDEKQEFNLHDGLDSTILILKYRLKANQQRPEIKITKEYGELNSIWCYPGQLNQVFLNLLANGIDAIDDRIQEESVAEVEITPGAIAIATEFDAERAIIRIRDNGMGMPAEVREKIFQQGFTTKEVGKGTGLGMAIARSIVEDKHGGAIACRSEVGVGTEFEVTLPLS
ncbi:response regulator [Roseofilum sp. BLCC_M143]|uniref:histidine kinase n=2 Tax=Roseofilum TaxID=1233426 RepID=A0ABT7BUL5_9CYAN|nr:response regulator [Roseofilum casamattae BLCC-M143]